MLQTLLTLENAAASENQDWLEASIQRQPDELSLRDCMLDRALELWFAAPEELSQFATPPSNSITAIGVKQVGAEMVEEFGDTGLADGAEEVSLSELSEHRVIFDF